VIMTVILTGSLKVLHQVLFLCVFGLKSESG